MLELHTAKVEQPSVEFQRFSWVLKPTIEDISTYYFIILRSNSPEGPFDVVGTLQNTFHFDDFEINQKSEWRTFYYKLRIASDTAFKDSNSYYITAAPDPIALEMIRKKNVALNYGSTAGVPIEVFVRKTWGSYCPDCFDHIKKRRTTSNCKTCYNTNYVGGFFSPVATKAFFGPSQKMINQLGFEEHPDKIIIETANYPVVSPGDIVKQDSIMRYRVESVRCTKRRTYIISQFLQLADVNANDIEYEL